MKTEIVSADARRSIWNLLLKRHNDEQSRRDGEKDSATCITETRNMKDKIYEVAKQGGPILNGAHVVTAGECFAAIEVDMRSKRCELLTDTTTEDGVPVLFLEAGADSCHLANGMEKECTEVAFPGFKGFSVFSAHVSRCTLRVCLVAVEK